ncbi:MAG TPA: tetratricopeptide repeat protein [Terriglobales bacterium]|nr:tetratricopeptide repeat protein [Terriglobales bacterium]
MRGPVTLFLVAVTATFSARADVIHLKNGRSIWADRIRENGPRIEYDLGDDSYAVPKSSVERIEAGGVPPRYASNRAGNEHDVPAFAPTSNLKNESLVVDKVIRNGKVDVEALGNLEQAGDAAAASSAYFIAGKHEFEGGNFAAARKYFETALRFDSQNPTVLNYYAALLVRTGNPAEALLYAERGARVAPDSPDTLAVLGYAQFASDRTADAIRSWKRSLSLRPDAMIQRYLEKAQREVSAESDFSQHESGHFTLKYEGKQTPDSLRRGVIETLESQYDDLTRELGVAPRGSISVTLYTDQAFFDVTQAPSWSGAVNDGKLRIPVEGVSTVTSDLARVLKHELAHSFINQLSGGRCPQWLNEGVAQALEPKSLSSRGRRLAQLFKAQQEIPYNALEGSFMQFSTLQAIIAYDESLAAVQYINDTYGMSDIRRILERLGQGSSAEAALRATVHSDYGQMEAEVGKYLADKYGE